jgi:hypothetical protein
MAPKWRLPRQDLAADLPRGSSPITFLTGLDERYFSPSKSLVLSNIKA